MTKACSGFRNLAFLSAVLCPPLVVAQVGQPGGNPAGPQQTLPPAQAEPGAAQPRLELSATEWNFGTVWQGEPLSFDITLKNSGGAPLHVKDVHSSCGCTVARRPQDVIQPGESATLSIGYHSERRVGPANQTVTLVSDDPNQPSVAIAVRGEVRKVFDLDPPDGLMFPRVMRESAESRKVQIKNLFDDKLFLKLKDGSDPHYELELKEIVPGMQYELTATTKPPLPNGAVSTDARLETGLPRLPELTIRVHAYVQPRVSVSPLMLYVPTSLIKPSDWTVNVRTLGDKPVNITALTPSTDKITAKILPPKPNQGNDVQIRVSLPPASELPADGGSVQITTDAPELEYQTFVVRISTRRPPPPPGLTTRPAVPVPPGAAGGAIQTTPQRPAQPVPPPPPGEQKNQHP